MKPSEIQALVQFGRIGMQIVSERLLLVLGMVISAVLFGWVMVDPHWVRVASACGFAVLVYWPVVRREQTKAPQPAQGDE